MSKLKGNVIDPLDLIDSYGCDALRFTLAALAAQGRDIKLAESRIEGNRNFCTKLWNAARFCEINGCRLTPGFDPRKTEATINKWIVGELAEAGQKVALALEEYKFNDAAQTLYRYTWDLFCDWYIELAKPILTGEDERAKRETQATAAWVLEQLIHYLHPLMPFITEELYGQTAERNGQRLISASWPIFDDSYIDKVARDETNWVIRLISEIRSVRAEMNVPPGARIPLEVQGAGSLTKVLLDTYGDLIRTLARIATIAPAKSHVAKGAVQVVIDEATFVLPLADVIDVEKERARLSKEAARLAGEIEKLEKKFGNPDFIARAPEDVVEEQRERCQEAKAQHTSLSEALGRLIGA